MAATCEILLEMNQVAGSGGRTGLTDCSVKICKGEVVGLAGLEGSGQGAFLRLASGLSPTARGTVSVDGRTMTGENHSRFQAAGVGFLPSGRLEEGLMPGLSIAEHVALKSSRGFLIRWSRVAHDAQEKIDGFHVVGLPRTTVESLSGGNQQRLLLSFLPDRPRLLLLENPTRGLDLESAMWIWRHLLKFTKQGAGIVFSSSELDEILMVADRILVFFDGRIIADVAADRTDSRQLGRAIAGKL
jgi:simple sugar transport system ATP-binding protein